MNREVTNTPLFIKYLRAYENNPRSTVFAPLAEGYRKAGMLEKAMDILKEGVRYHPSYTTGYLGLASCYFDLSQYNLTYLTLRPLVEGNRDNIRLQKLFARTCHKMGQNDEALETYKYLLFINPKDKDTAHWVKQLEDKELEGQLDNPSDNSISNSLQNAENIFSLENLSISPNGNNVDNWQQIDFANKNLQNSSDKKEVKNEKEGKQTQLNVPTYTLAQLYQQQGHLDKARDVLEKLVILNPGDLNIKKKLEEIKKIQEDKEAIPYLSSDKKEKKDPIKLLEEKMEAFFQAIQNKANAYKLRSSQN